MSHGKVKTGHLELAICLAVPLVVMIVMILVGFFYGRQQDRFFAQRNSLLNLIPVLEQKVSAAHQSLKPFVTPEGTKDMAAALSLCVSDAAQKHGFVIRSSNVEKQIGPDAGVWVDYKFTLSGEGSLTALIAMLDYLGQPPRRFRAAQITLKTTRLIPETACSADLILVSRAVTERSGASLAGQVGSVTPAMAENLGVEVGNATDKIKSWNAVLVHPLSLVKLASRVHYVQPETVPTESEPQVAFHLTGVIGSKSAPMIMTDRGVFGVGDEVDGLKIESIGSDKVTVVSKSGRREIVKLYSGGGGL